MVIVKLKGGLGNQMFQYAFGRRIALVNKVPLKLDLKWFQDTGKDTLRAYELKYLKVCEEFATSEEIKGIISDKNQSRLLFLLFSITYTLKQTTSCHV